VATALDHTSHGTGSAGDLERPPPRRKLRGLEASPIDLQRLDLRFQRRRGEPETGAAPKAPASSKRRSGPARRVRYLALGRGRSDGTRRGPAFWGDTLRNSAAATTRRTRPCASRIVTGATDSSA